MKRRQTHAQRRKLDRIVAAEEVVATKRKAYEAASPRLRSIRHNELVKAVAKALKLERAS